LAINLIAFLKLPNNTLNFKIEFYFSDFVESVTNQIAKYGALVICFLFICNFLNKILLFSICNLYYLTCKRIRLVICELIIYNSFFGSNFFTNNERNLCSKNLTNSAVVKPSKIHRITKNINDLKSQFGSPFPISFLPSCYPALFRFFTFLLFPPNKTWLFID